jgi:aspartyl-tRNA(Asn)/glutamyl-tRNA(Gln) amidotransferase subunit A
MASGARLLSVLVLYPCGSGNAAIIPSILPNRLRLKCPSASEMPVSFNLPDCRLRQPTISTSEEEAASAFSKLIESGEVAQLSDPLSRIGGYAAQTVTSQDFIRAQRIRRILQQKMDAIFQQFDVLVAPSLPIGASTLDTNLETDLSFADPIGGIGNLCGLPAQSVPCGFTKGGLPIGIQFLGQVLNDDAVIATAEMYQARTDWHRKHPPLN